MAASSTTARRAIGIVRVSQTRGREGESFHSPTTQLERIRDDCNRKGVKLVQHFEELDVSGQRPLAKRWGLNQAVRAIEEGKADEIVVAYFDRLVRSLKVQAEIVERVERAGGEVLTLDAGQITNGKASTKLQANILGAIAQYVADVTRDKVGEAQERAVARGATPWARVPLGYTRTNGTLTPNPVEIPLVVRAFEMRDKGETLMAIRAMLELSGVVRSPRGVQVLLASRIYLGEVRFGKHFNPHAHEPIIERELWERVQRRKIPRGPMAKSDKLLARLGVLRCGTCDSRMTAGMVKQQGGYPVYRCASANLCDRHMLVSAEIAEGEIIAFVKRSLEGVTGTASGASGVAQARVELDEAQTDLDAALRSFAATALENEPAAVERLTELRERRERAMLAYEEAADAEGALSVAITVNDWDELSHEAKRELIKATIKRAVVHPGRGADRIEIEAR